jgi:hypothetical protein
MNTVREFPDPIHPASLNTSLLCETVDVSKARTHWHSAPTHAEAGGMASLLPPMSFCLSQDPPSMHRACTGSWTVLIISSLCIPTSGEQKHISLQSTLEPKGHCWNSSRRAMVTGCNLLAWSDLLRVLAVGEHRKLQGCRVSGVLMNCVWSQRTSATCHLVCQAWEEVGDLFITPGHFLPFVPTSQLPCNSEWKPQPQSLLLTS